MGNLKLSKLPNFIKNLIVSQELDWGQRDPITLRFTVVVILLVQPDAYIVV